MALFHNGVEKADPLLVQLTAQSVSAIIVGADMCGENASGSTSRPMLYRPAVAGSYGGFLPPAPPALSGTATPQSKFLFFFTTPPSVPAVASASSIVPFQILWRVPTEQGFVLFPGESAVLYARTDSDHQWNARLFWEEE